MTHKTPTIPTIIYNAYFTVSLVSIRTQGQPNFVSKHIFLHDHKNHKEKIGGKQSRIMSHHFRQC